MHKTQIGALFSLTLVVLAVSHLEALRSSWYWIYRWYDIWMHLLGGIVVALLILFLVLVFKGEHAKLFSNDALLAFVIIVGTLCVGLAWEVFEHFYNVAFDPDHRFDTGVDLIMDVVGALVVYMYANASLSKGRGNLEDNSNENDG